jgi:hypothetical protein
VVRAERDERNIDNIGIEIYLDFFDKLGGFPSRTKWIIAIVDQRKEACTIPVVAVRILGPLVDDIPIVDAVDGKAHSASELRSKSAPKRLEAENAAIEALVAANQRRNGERWVLSSVDYIFRGV